jgi:methylated-DNA-[protein]-cysteine S-methyltransferase
MSTTVYTTVHSPIGELLLAGDGQSLQRLSFLDGGRPAVDQRWEHRSQPFANVTEQLAEYFAGHRHRFDVDLALAGSPFELRVWRSLVEIPYGETISYGELARAIDQPDAARAVGLANSRNPVAVIVPCHRVIGANGTLTGYAGGLDRKRFLLDLEAGVLSLPAA